ncbi:unnamed protein product [Heligmosomoides polygyrus]|uniref:Col_cuticle_N domain-containing protein n=1 Tax=Heligmosomoides polygyrus TaxID=6339 RepID=A0A183GDE3_HELPZ|nr:unnamed protein product [Heligmosomoides polygyrus]
MSNQWTHINATSEISEAQQAVLLSSAIFGVIAVIPNAILFTVLVCVKSYRVDNVVSNHLYEQLASHYMRKEFQEKKDSQ